MSIKVAVVGAMGKMGQEVIKAVIADDSCELVAAVDKYKVGENIHSDVHVEGNVEAAIKANKPDVVVDFTQPNVVYENVKIYMQTGTKAVIGTTGLSEEQLKEIEKISKEKNNGIIIVPNFSTGAVLMMKFAQMAAKYFKNAEILEYHHNQKKDAPSGTAIKTAQMMSYEGSNFKCGNIAEEELIEGSRGGDYKNSDGSGDISIHSIRMPGYVASQEVIFGASGQTLKIRHDSINRECYMDGVLLAINHVYKNNNFVYGLENIL